MKVCIFAPGLINQHGRNNVRASGVACPVHLNLLHKVQVPPGAQWTGYWAKLNNNLHSGDTEHRHSSRKSEPEFCVLPTWCIVNTSITSQDEDTIPARLKNRCCCGNTISNTYSVCICVVLVIQHAKRMRRTMLPLRLYNIFPYYLIKGTIFGKKKVIGHKIVILISLQLFTETFLNFKRILRDIGIKVGLHTTSRKVPVIKVRF